MCKVPWTDAERHSGTDHTAPACALVFVRSHNETPDLLFIKQTRPDLFEDRRNVASKGRPESSTVAE